MTNLQFKYSEDSLILLENLAFILFINDYFGSIEKAQEYIDNIILRSEQNISNSIYKPAPPKLEPFGNYYSTATTTKRTSWYFFFFKKENKILVAFISNNHQEIANSLNTQL